MPNILLIWLRFYVFWHLADLQQFLFHNMIDYGMEHIFKVKVRNDQQININARHHGVDSRPYELPIIDPVATVQDQHRLQVNLRPYHTHHNPIMEFIAPSAPRLDLEDLPPSYEEAVKIVKLTDTINQRFDPRLSGLRNKSRE